MNNIIKKNNIYEVPSINQSLKLCIIGKDSNQIDYNNDLIKFRKEEKSLINSYTNIITKNIFFVNQVHGDEVLIVTEPIVDDVSVIGNADAMITTIPGSCLVIRTADCVPVFIFDPKKKVLGAVHSGWKGTKLKITKKTAFMMNKKFGSQYADMMVYILPSISVSAYEVSKDVADFFPDDLEMINNKIHINLWSNIEKSLIELGINEENIFNNEICNYTNNDDFFSHRKGDIGRNLNFAFFQ